MTENTAVCTECGTAAHANARFCEACGAVLPVSIGDSAAGVTSASGQVFVSGPFDTLVGPGVADGAPDPATPVEPSPPRPRARPPEAVLAPFMPGAVTRGPAPASPATPAPSAPNTSSSPRPSSPALTSASPASTAPGAGGSISAAIPSAAKAGTVQPRHPTAAADKPHFFTEQYAGSQYATPPPGPIVSAPVPTLPPPDGVVIQPSRRLGCLGAITILLGLNWLVQGVLGFVQAAVTWRTGSLLGQDLAPDVVAKVQVAVIVAALVSIVWILIGVKILLAPGRWSLGFTGVCFFLNAIAILLALALVQNPSTNVIAIVTAIVLFEVVMGLAALTAAQAMD